MCVIVHIRMPGQELISAEQLTGLRDELQHNIPQVFADPLAQQRISTSVTGQLQGKNPQVSFQFTMQGDALVGTLAASGREMPFNYTQILNDALTKQHQGKIPQSGHEQAIRILNNALLTEAIYLSDNPSPDDRGRMEALRKSYSVVASVLGANGVAIDRTGFENHFTTWKQAVEEIERTQASTGIRVEPLPDELDKVVEVPDRTEVLPEAVQRDVRMLEHAYKGTVIPQLVADTETGTEYYEIVVPGPLTITKNSFPSDVEPNTQSQNYEIHSPVVIGQAGAALMIENEGQVEFLDGLTVTGDYVTVNGLGNTDWTHYTRLRVIGGQIEGLIVNYNGFAHLTGVATRIDVYVGEQSRANLVNCRIGEKEGISLNVRPYGSVQLTDTTLSGNVQLTDNSGFTVDGGKIQGIYVEVPDGDAENNRATITLNDVVVAESVDIKTGFAMITLYPAMLTNQNLPRGIQCASGASYSLTIAGPHPLDVDSDRVVTLPSKSGGYANGEEIARAYREELAKEKEAQRKSAEVQPELLSVANVRLRLASAESFPGTLAALLKQVDALASENPSDQDHAEELITQILTADTENMTLVGAPSDDESRIMSAKEKLIANLQKLAEVPQNKQKLLRLLSTKTGLTKALSAAFYMLDEKDNRASYLWDENTPNMVSDMLKHLGATRNELQDFMLNPKEIIDRLTARSTWQETRAEDILLRLRVAAGPERTQAEVGLGDSIARLSYLNDEELTKLTHVLLNLLSPTESPPDEIARLREIVTAEMYALVRREEQPLKIPDAQDEMALLRLLWRNPNITYYLIGRGGLIHSLNEKDNKSRENVQAMLTDLGASDRDLYIVSTDHPQGVVAKLYLPKLTYQHLQPESNEESFQAEAARLVSEVAGIGMDLLDRNTVPLRQLLQNRYFANKVITDYERDLNYHPGYIFLHHALQNWKNNKDTSIPNKPGRFASQDIKRLYNLNVQLRQQLATIFQGETLTEQHMHHLAAQLVASFGRENRALPSNQVVESYANSFFILNEVTNWKKGPLH